MLRTVDLTYRYPAGETLSFPDLACPAGQTRLLLGNSGSGKTTLLQLLAGLRRPTAGRVTVAGQDLGELTDAELDHFRGQRIGIVFQTPHFLQALTVRENVALARRLAGQPSDPARVDELLERLGLGGRADVRPARLSVGQQQRAAIARALVNRPALILADEPTSALDDGNTEGVVALLREEAAAVNATLLIVTHDQRLTRLVPQRTTL